MTPLKSALLRACMLLLCGAPLPAATVYLTLLPSSAIFGAGDHLQVEVNYSPDTGDPNLYAFQFDLQYDPAVFQLVAITGGDIFGCGTCYLNGSIDPIAGTVTFQAGVNDFSGSYSGGSGRLALFEFVVLAGDGPSVFTAQNIGLQSYQSAQTLGGFDITPVNAAPTVSVTVVPEPGTPLLSGLAIAMVLAASRLRRRSSR